MNGPAGSQTHPDAAGRYSDAAHRMSDTVTTHLLGQGQAAVGRWLAFRLSDGVGDSTLYDTRADAIRHQLHEQQCVYVVITPDGMTPHSAEVMLRFARQAYDNGMRLTDPDAERRHGRTSLVDPTAAIVRGHL